MEILHTIVFHDQGFVVAGAICPVRTCLVSVLTVIDFYKLLISSLHGLVEQSVPNRCVIDVICGVFFLCCHVAFLFLCGRRSFCHRTEADLFLFLSC